ncbi:MAG: hypothetical protein ACI37Q_05020 [Candidatus Gastranaerophilaceae bacterium]
MPEISMFLFDLNMLFKLFPKEDREFRQKIEEYEQQAQVDMAQNRIKLFSEFGYESEFDKAYF